MLYGCYFIIIITFYTTKIIQTHYLVNKLQNYNLLFLGLLTVIDVR